MTVKELRERLVGLGSTYDNHNIEVWLPGSYIRLGAVFPNSKPDKVLIEGNLNPGLALIQD